MIMYVCCVYFHLYGKYLVCHFYYLFILVHPVANKVFILDSSENDDQPDFDSVVTVDYNQINPNSPSSRSEQPMRIASIQFNSVKFIGKLKSSPTKLKTWTILLQIL